MANARLTISQLHLAGIAPSKFEGRQGSVAEAVAIDFQSSKGTFQAAQALVEISTESLLNERVDVMLNCTSGDIFMFSKTSGKVWKIIANGTISLAYTTAPTTGDAGCLGAMEFEGYVYWATEDYLHRIATTGVSDWTTNAAPNWQLLPVTDDAYHPMAIVNGRLLIGDNNQVHQIVSNTFVENVLDILTYHRITWLGNFDIFLIAGTIVDNNINASTLYRWNGWSDTWNIESNVPEVGLNALVPLGNSYFVHAGREGNFYQYDGSFLSSGFLIPGTFTGTNEAIVYPNAVANYKGKTLFALSNKAGAPVTAGIYAFHTSNNMLYPRVLSLEYILAANAVGTGIQITSMITHASTLYVAWTSATASGIKKIDAANKQDGAYITTRVAYVDREKQVAGWDVYVNYTELPANTSVEVYCRLNYATEWVSMNTVHDAPRKYFIASIRKIANVYEWKVVLRTAGNTSPVIDEINIEVGK